MRSFKIFILVLFVKTTYSQHIVHLDNSCCEMYTPSYPWASRDIIDYNGEIFFLGRSKEYGDELWKYDGHSNHVDVFKDILPGEFGVHPRFLMRYKDKFYFIALDSVGRGASHLYQSDGTPENTFPIYNTNTEYGFLYKYKNQICFFKKDLSGTFTLVFFDGLNFNENITFANQFSSVGIVASNDKFLYAFAWPNSCLISINIIDSTYEILTDLPKYFIKYDTIGDLFLFAKYDSIHGTELWVTDGSVNGTRLVKDINKTPPQPNRLWLADGIPRSELERTKSYSYYAKHAGFLYFFASDSLYSSNLFLYKTAGDSLSTVRVSNISFADSWSQDNISCNPEADFYIFDSKIYLPTNPLSYYDLNNDSLIFFNENDTLYSLPSGFHEFNGKLYCFGDGLFEIDSFNNVRHLSENYCSNYMGNKRHEFNNELYFFSEKVYNGFRGTEHLSKLIRTAANASEVISLSDLEIFPNPSSKVLHINFDTEINNGNITFYNLLGSKVISYLIGSSMNNIDVSQLSNGIYVCEIEYNQNKILRKIVIQNH